MNERNMTPEDELPGQKWKRCSVVDVSGGKVKSDAVKNNTAYELGMLCP